jgi:hypothetical protein
MLQHAGFYNTDIAAGLSVLHDLPIFMRQALCDELGCNVHLSMSQTWLVLYVARRCSTSRVAACRTALPHVVSLSVQLGRLVAVAPPRRPRAAPRAARARRCADDHRFKLQDCRDGVGEQSGDGDDDIRSDSGLEHRSGVVHCCGMRRFRPGGAHRGGCAWSVSDAARPLRGGTADDVARARVGVRVLPHLYSAWMYACRCIATQRQDVYTCIM